MATLDVFSAGLSFTSMVISLMLPNLNVIFNIFYVIHAWMKVINFIKLLTQFKQFKD